MVAAENNRTDKKIGCVPVLPQDRSLSAGLLRPQEGQWEHGKPYAQKTVSVATAANVTAISEQESSGPKVASVETVTRSINA